MRVIKYFIVITFLFNKTLQFVGSSGEKVPTASNSVNLMTDYSHDDGYTNYL